MTNTNTKPIWEADDRDSWTLWAPEAEGGDWLASIARAYPERYSFSGSSLYAADRTKPMEWSITIPGKHTRRLHNSGMSVREAKRLALEILETFRD